MFSVQVMWLLIFAGAAMAGFDLCGPGRRTFYATKNDFLPFAKCRSPGVPKGHPEVRPNRLLSRYRYFADIATDAILRWAVQTRLG